jgi:hypothetical protein
MSVDLIGDGIALRSKGDIVSHDGTAPISISPGTDGQILSAQSSATSGLVWVTANTAITNNDFVLISSSRLTTTAASIEFSSITQDYRDLMIIFQGKDNYNQNSSFLSVRLNNDTSVGYRYPFVMFVSSTVTAYNSDNDTDGALIRGAVTGSTANVNSFGCAVVYISQYSNSSIKKGFMAYGGAPLSTGTVTTMGGLSPMTSAITSVQLKVYASTLFSAGTYAALYGVR